MIGLDPYTGTEQTTLRESVVRYMQLRLAEGLDEKGDTYRHIKKHLLERFCGAFGEWPLASLRVDHLRTWAAALVNPRTSEPMDPLTRRHHLVDVKTFFKRAVREDWIRRDPTIALVLPAIEQEDVTVMPVRDAFEFFRANRHARAIGRIALEAFGGLRYTSAGRICKDCIKFERRGIEMPANKHKSRKRKFRQGHPANLWTWLHAAPEACWTLTLRQYAEEKKEMFVMAGLREMVLKTPEHRERARALKNIWRHSFASYLLALTGDFGPVGYLMQHSRQTTTEIYEGCVDRRDAKLYFSITPQSVLLSWDDFVSTHTEQAQVTNPQPAQ
jgi:site-specific recombinase XerD